MTGGSDSISRSRSDPAGDFAPGQVCRPSRPGATRPGRDGPASFPGIAETPCDRAAVASASTGRPPNGPHALYEPIAPDEFTAAALETGARSLAGIAAATLAEEDGLSGADLTRWQGFLARTALDLAASIRFGSARSFHGMAGWQLAAVGDAPAEVARLRRAFRALAAVVGERLPGPGHLGAVRLLTEAATLAPVPATRATIALDPRDATDRLALELLQAVLEGDRRTATRNMECALDAGLSVRDAYLRVIGPALVEIGRLWHAGDVSIAEEHLCTEAIRTVLAVVSYRAPVARPRSITAVTAAVAENAHDVGIRIVSDLLELDGFKVIPLGADVPATEVARAAILFEADCVLISAALLCHLTAVRNTVSVVRASTPSTLPIIVGGGAFSSDPDLAQRLGADAVAVRAEDAAAVVLRLLGRA